MSADELVRDVDVEADWREFASCKGQTALFFAKKAERPEARARREARAQIVCEACPVRSACQNYARVSREYGYWGGESEEDRHLAGFTLTAPIGARVRLVSERGRAGGDGVDLVEGRVAR